MPSIRIKNGDLPSGAGVEGGRKKRRDESQGSPAGQEEPAKKEKMPQKSRGQPQFEDTGNADIFYTKTK
ncbi:MAG TPA: hypothetical protein PLU40_03670 [Methanoculleus sp.]|mgnify:FL=1|jgi:hypothetical protein|nr:hypothetical protein [Methanoculleus sp.]HQD24101.1 hypothetical protein [Methanoculleus sp.]